MGWPKFQTWVADNLVDWGEAQVDQMAILYSSVRDEATTDEARRLSGPEALQLESTVKAVTAWIYKRCRVGGFYKGGSIYGHLAPRQVADLADVKYQCVLDWGTSGGPAPTASWPLSYKAMAKAPLSIPGNDNWEFQQLLKDEATSMQEACKQVRKLPAPARQIMQKFVLTFGENINPNSRT